MLWVLITSEYEADAHVKYVYALGFPPQSTMKGSIGRIAVVAVQVWRMRRGFSLLSGISLGVHRNPAGPDLGCIFLS